MRPTTPHKLRPVQATIFDGKTVQPCTLELAKSSEANTDLTWIDLRLESLKDPSAAAMFEALGISAEVIEQELKGPLNINFQVSSNGVYGVAWLGSDTKDLAAQMAFSWDGKRHVTIRTDGDQATKEVQNQISDRAQLLLAEPAAVLGVVLQLYLATVQRDLATLCVTLGALDNEILDANSPQQSQANKLSDLRQSFSTVALLFPSYTVNVKAALVDPSTLPGMTPAGARELEAFQIMCAGTTLTLTNLLDAYRNANQDLQSQISGWQSNRINQLTIVTIIFLPATLLTGYFGMNFAWLDDQTNSLFSYLLLGVSLPIVLFGVAVYMLRKAGFSFSGTSPKNKKRRRQRAHKTHPHKSRG